MTRTVIALAAILLILIAVGQRRQQVYCWDNSSRYCEVAVPVR